MWVGGKREEVKKEEDNKGIAQREKKKREVEREKRPGRGTNKRRSNAMGKHNHLFTTCVLSLVCGLNLRDGFWRWVEEEQKEEWEQNAPVDGRLQMAVPRGVAARLATALVHRRLRLDSAADTTLASGLHLTVTERQKGFGNHKDRYRTALADEPRVVVEGQVGVLYLGGDGRMVFTRDATGQETSIDIRANRFIAWNNSDYTHRVEQPAGGMPRRILGPLTRSAAANSGSSGLVGVCGGATVTACPAWSGYKCSNATYTQFGAGTSFPSAQSCADLCFAAPQSLERAYFQWKSAEPGEPGECWCGSSPCTTLVLNDDYHEYCYNIFTGTPCDALATTGSSCGGKIMGLRLAAKAWPRSGRVKQGGLVKYSLRVRNKAALDGAGVRVLLPAYTTYVKSKARPWIGKQADSGVVVNAPT